LLSTFDFSLSPVILRPHIRYNGAMKADTFLENLTEAGFDFFTGVPCSYLAPLVAELNRRPAEFHLPAPREDLAAGLAAGAWLGGRQPLVYMQNSGLGYSLEAFASLHMIYRIPVMLLVSWRGPADPGWEEHRVMGDHTRELLDTFGIPWVVWKAGAPEIPIPLRGDDEAPGPRVILVEKGVLA